MVHGFFFKITKKFEQFIRQENNNSDTTDGAFVFLSNLPGSVQKDFEEVIDGKSDKKIIDKNICVAAKYKRRQCRKK